MPISLVRCLKVDPVSGLATVQFQMGTEYDGQWRPWLPAGVRGNRYYTESEIPYESVVVADVQRGKGSVVRGKQIYTQPFYLHKKTLLQLAELPEARFSLFLLKNKVEPSYSQRTAEAITQPAAGGEDVDFASDNQTDSCDSGSEDDKSGADPGVASPGLAHNDSDPDSSSNSDSDGANANTSPCPPPQRSIVQKPGQRKGKQAAVFDRHAVTTGKNKRRHAKDNGTREVHDANNRRCPLPRKQNKKDPKAAGCSGTKRDELAAATHS